MGRKGTVPPPTAPVPNRRPSQNTAAPNSSSEYPRESEEVPTHVASSQPKLFLARPFVEASLVKGSLKTLVSLPKYLDVMEWVAVNSKYIEDTQTLVTQ
jgi:MOB kinase activator 1